MEAKALRNELKQMLSSLPCLTCDHPNTKCPNWQTAVKTFLSRPNGSMLLGPDYDLLLSLPDHLRETLLGLRKAIITFGANGPRATASEVAKITGKARAIESAYLNQLTREGFLKKERIRRLCYFKVINNGQT
jgi:hypothetical protein